MKRNLITKKELEHVQKYLSAMGRFQMKTDGGARVEKIDRHEVELSIEITEGEYRYMYFDERTTIDDLGIDWRREVEE